MAGKENPWSISRRQQVGVAVIALRGIRVPWKVIEVMFQRERTQLWRVAREARMQQKSTRMQQLDTGKENVKTERVNPIAI